MALNLDSTTEMDYQNATLPKSGNSTPERPFGPTSCARLEATKADIYLLEKAVSEFGSLPYCDIPGCPVHETPTSSPVKSQPTKKKDEDGFISPHPSKSI
ncbi:hypothetical protein TNIN_370091 [Trichonephila inaurata madagascariensis]|uniref:Uncharacterized protein n=1 Tax=Trichonephila inaurata madagascariensis TaxID=2747483 RepID=A0A8X7BXB6_9ARAC|nr:hypothetical protein TNIN_370091 [Trichonephila inaurata madagascariensis]